MASDPEDKLDIEQDNEQGAFRSARSGARSLTIEHLDAKGFDRHMELRFRQQTGRRPSQRDRGISRYSGTIPGSVLKAVRSLVGTKPGDFDVESVEEFRRKRRSFALGRVLGKDRNSDEKT